MKSSSFALENNDNDDDDDDNDADLMIIKKNRIIFVGGTIIRNYMGEVFVVSEIIKVEEINTYVIESLIILYITKTESNNCFLILID